MALLDLPVSLLQEILAFTLDISNPCNFQTGTPILFRGRDHKRKPDCEGSILPIFLTSRLVYAVAAPLVYKSTIFDFTETCDLDAFLSVIGATNLANIRYISVDLYLESPETHSEELDVLAIQQWTTLLDRLPVALRGLRLFLPVSGWPRFITDQGTHPLLRAAVQRFHRLQELSLINERKWVHWDLFSVSDAYTQPRESNPDKPQGYLTTVFPFITRLHVHGLLKEQIDSMQITEAFSDRTLPALRSLLLQGLDSTPEVNNPKSSFLSDVLQALPPLERFEWMRDDEREHFHSLTPQCLMDTHLTTLLSQHGRTIQHLKLNLAGHLFRKWCITEHSVAALLTSSSGLRHATITAPFLDIILLLEAISLHSPRREISRSLQTLNLTLGGLEEQLEGGLKSGQLSTLCSDTKLWRVCRLWLQVVIGERPVLSRFGRHQRLCRNNVYLYPDLQHSLTECISGCVSDADTRDKPLEQTWCRVSLVDIHDYSPFWSDTPEDSS